MKDIKSSKLKILFGLLFLGLSSVVFFFPIQEFWELQRKLPQLDLDTQILLYIQTDLQYLPLAKAISQGNFGDSQVLEHKGQGLSSFPYFSVLPMSLNLSLFGKMGWIWGRSLIYLAYWFCFFWIALLILEAPFWSCCFAFLFFVGYWTRWDWILPKMVRVLGSPEGFPTTLQFFSGIRFPRPLVTDLYFWIFIGFFLKSLKRLSFLWSQIHSNLEKDFRSSSSFSPSQGGAFWITFGGLLAWESILVQGSLYLSFLAFLLLMFLFMYLFIFLLRTRWDGGTIWSSVKLWSPCWSYWNIREIRRWWRVWVFLSLGPCLLIPFVLQRWLSPKEVALRLGLERISRTYFLTSLFNDPLLGWMVLFFLIGVLSFGLLLRMKRIGWWVYFLAQVVVLLPLVSQVLRPLFALMTGTMIQGYQFTGAARVGWLAFFMIGILISIKTVFDSLKWTLLRWKIPMFFFWVPQGVFVFFIIFQAAVFYERNGKVGAPALDHLRADFELYGELGSRYQEDFDQLIRFLKRPDFSKIKVLSTFDHQVAAWWVSFQGGFLYNPDVFLSNLPQSEIVFRFAENCFFLGVSAPECLGLLTYGDPERKYLGMNNAIHNFFFAHALYHTHGLFSKDPPAAYSEAQQRSSLETPPTMSWHLQISEEEQKKLLQNFENRITSSSSSPTYQMDALLLFNHGRLSYLKDRFLGRHPKFVSLFSNTTFSLYVRRDLFP